MLAVNLPNHSYQIIVKKGALDNCGQWVKSLWKKQKIAIITDSNVEKLYADKVKQELNAVGFESNVLVVPAGEKSKSLQYASDLYDQLADLGFTRSDGIIALGGGVVGDLAGFVASTFMRGLHFLQIPTTLLAQVDSSIGGKTAVNTKRAKNLVGTFAQPDGVLIDPIVLQTLCDRLIREGIAEIVKSAVIADKDLWQFLSTISDEHDLLNHAEKVITAALNVKKKVVEEDVFDHGSRLILNFGHTIGHAIENTVGYGIVSHGEGVAIGMMMINAHAEVIGLSPENSTQALKAMLERFHLPTSYPDLDEQAIYTAITHDKKARGSQLKIITLKEIGQAQITPIPIENIKEYIKGEN